jgi:glutathione S-transferase
MKLFKFAYSPYARKVQAVLDLMGVAYDAVEVSYGDRRELVAATGGYIQVPVFVDDAGQVITESRRICEELLVGEAATRLAPAPFEGPIWAYSDFCDGPLEDVLFRIATPLLVAQKATAEERALFVYVKERKFGSGCVERWTAEREVLMSQGRKLLAPTARTLAGQAFLFGAAPTLADAALYGNFAMLSAADRSLPDEFGTIFPTFMARFEERCRSTSAQRKAP